MQCAPLLVAPDRKLARGKCAASSVNPHTALAGSWFGSWQMSCATASPAPRSSRASPVQQPSAATRHLLSVRAPLPRNTRSGLQSGVKLLAHSATTGACKGARPLQHAAGTCPASNRCFCAVPQRLRRNMLQRQGTRQRVCPVASTLAVNSATVQSLLASQLSDRQSLHSIE